MTQYLIMCRSLTYAQKAARALERSGITTGIVKAPQELSSKGCAYAVTMRGKLRESQEMLKKHDIPIGKIFARTVDGAYTEVQR